MAQNVFSSCGTIVVGCFLYTDPGLSSPAPNGIYSDGTNAFTVSGGAGEVTASAACGSFTTTTTTTAPYGTFRITNTSADLDLSGLRIGGGNQIVTSGAFPSTPFTGNIEGKTTLLTIPGSYTVELTGLTSGTINQRVRVTGSTGVVQTETISTNPFSGDITFPSLVYFDTLVRVEIELLPAL